MNPAHFANIFEEFRAPSWRPWRTILEQITDTVSEVYIVAGRGAGKSRIIGLIACCYACREYKIPPGGNIYVGVFAPDRKQAKLTFNYIKGLILSNPHLSALIDGPKGIKRDEIHLKNGVIIEVLTASMVTLRGRSYGAVIMEEAAFFPTENTAHPDAELIAAVEPGLARVPNSILCVISSAYARSGVLYDNYTRYSDGHDPHVLAVKRTTVELNPTFNQATIDRALLKDYARAAAEYLSEWRSDIESYVPLEAIENCTVPGRLELPPFHDTTYRAFVDPSGGAADAFGLAIGHVATNTSGQTIAVIDLMTERKPEQTKARNFISPEAVVQEYSDILKRYGVRKVIGDRYAGQWPVEAFQRYGIDYQASEQSKTDIYRDALPLLNARRIELLESDRLKAQLLSLERRTSRGGRDMIDHKPGSHDDLANVVCGLATTLVQPAEKLYQATW